MLNVKVGTNTTLYGVFICYWCDSVAKCLSECLEAKTGKPNFAIFIRHWDECNMVLKQGFTYLIGE